MQGVTGMDDFLTREHSSENTMPRTVQGKDINRQVVYGAFEITEQGCLWVEIPKKREREGIQEE